MYNITLTRFNVNPFSYSYADQYRGCWKSTNGDCHGIDGYMDGLIKQMARHTDEPAAWSFSEWKPRKATNNKAENWLRATAVILEYNTKNDAAEVAVALHDKATSLGYAHILMYSKSRNGDATTTIIFPLAEAIDDKQYARLASVLMEELGQYRAASGNMAMTHLIHVDETCSFVAADGAVIAPAPKIKDTFKLYQSMDCKRFEASSAKAGVQLVAPMVTSSDGLFEFPETAAERILRQAGLPLSL